MRPSSQLRQCSPPPTTSSATRAAALATATTGVRTRWPQPSSCRQLACSNCASPHGLHRNASSCAPSAACPAGRVGQQAAIGIATERGAATRLNDSLSLSRVGQHVAIGHDYRTRCSYPAQGRTGMKPLRGPRAEASLPPDAAAASTAILPDERFRTFTAVHEHAPDFKWNGHFADAAPQLCGTKAAACAVPKR